MRNTSGAAAALAAFLLAPLSAAAAPFPLGLDAVHWGMTVQQVSDALPGLPRPPPLPPGTEGKGLRVTVPGYKWNDCTLVAVLAFAPDGLYDIRLVQSGASKSCRDDVLAAMTGVYGMPKAEEKMGFFFYNWAGDGVTVPGLDIISLGRITGADAHLHKAGAPDVPEPKPRAPQPPPG